MSRILKSGENQITNPYSSRHKAVDVVKKWYQKDTVICHFCKRLLLKPYPHTENFKQWNVEEVHNILKCHAFDEDLEEYLKLKDKFESDLREEV